MAAGSKPEKTMKIEIEFEGTLEAKLTIDGKEMSVKSRPGCTQLEGIKSPETEQTLGGMVASEIFGKIRDIQQAWAEVMEVEPEAGTWDMITDAAADAAYRRL